MHDNSYTTSFGNIYSGYIKTTKVCSTDVIGGTCWHKDLAWKDSNGLPYANCSGCSALYAVDGSWVEATGAPAPNCDWTTASGVNNACVQLVIDVNGEKKPNQIGKDIHYLFITQNGVEYDHSGPTYDLMMK